MRTPFGTVYSSNITPDTKTGIGTWTPDHFWRAMHNGRSKDGRLLYPAFPYPNYTQIMREDSNAILAYLWSLPPFAHVLSDAEIAAVVSYVRAAWGNDASAVTQLQVSRYRQ